MEIDQIGPIFVFSSGQRTGSTLLQRYLNSHSDIMIWGEHHGELINWLASLDALVDWQEKFSHHLELFINDGYNNFIANMMPPKEAIVDLKRVFFRKLWEIPAHQLGRKIWGFKEVRYDASIALELRKIFPTCSVIHITRNIKDCFLSLLHWERYGGWTRTDTLEFVQTWIRVNESFSKLLGENDISWVHSLTYEKLLDDPRGVTHNLVIKLGLEPECFDVNVFNHKIYTERYKGVDTRSKIDFSSLPEYDKSVLADARIRAVLKQYDLDDTWTEQIGN